MKAIIYHDSNFPERDIDINVNVSAHNISFSHIQPCNCIFVKLFRFPKKEIMQQIRPENGEIEKMQAYIRICISKQKTKLCLIVHYSIRTAGTCENQHIITEKKKVFTIQPEKQELIAFVRPYLSRLYEYTSKPDADLLVSFFNEYVEPSSLESIANRITGEEEKKAVNILKKYFGF